MKKIGCCCILLCISFLIYQNIILCVPHYIAQIVMRKCRRNASKYNMVYPVFLCKEYDVDDYDDETTHIKYTERTFFVYML